MKFKEFALCFAANFWKLCDWIFWAFHRRGCSRLVFAGCKQLETLASVLSTALHVQVRMQSLECTGSAVYKKNTLNSC